MSNQTMSDQTISDERSTSPETGRAEASDAPPAATLDGVEAGATAEAAEASRATSSNSSPEAPIKASATSLERAKSSEPAALPESDASSEASGSPQLPGDEAPSSGSSAGTRLAEPEEDLPARGADPRPRIVITAIYDTGVRIAALTLSHADAWERAQRALAGRDVAGLDLVELGVSSRAFAALRDKMGQPADAIAFYDLFPLAAHLPRAARMVAGQFLAAEILWALEEQGLLAGIPLNLRLDVPRSWGDRSPKAVHERLMAEGALDLSEKAIEDFRAIKNAWDGSARVGGSGARG